VPFWWRKHGWVFVELFMDGRVVVRPHREHLTPPELRWLEEVVMPEARAAQEQLKPRPGADRDAQPAERRVEPAAKEAVRDELPHGEVISARPIRDTNIDDRSAEPPVSSLTAAELEVFYKRGPRPRPFTGHPPRYSRARRFQRLCKRELGTVPDIVDVLAQMDASEDAACGEGEGKAAEVEKMRLRYLNAANNMLLMERECPPLANEQPDVTPRQQRFRVLVDDNFHFMDEGERYQAGDYADYDSALAKCRAIVDESLQEQLRPGMTADELYAAYRSFGADPWISEMHPEAETFSAWEYAKRRSQELCLANRGQADSRQPTAPGKQIGRTDRGRGVRGNDPPPS
jgi:hypothetical protein